MNKRKVMAGGIKPQNSLNKSTFSSSKTATTRMPGILDTVKSVGDNVPEHHTSPQLPEEQPFKRQKLDRHEVPMSAKTREPCRIRTPQPVSRQQSIPWERQIESSPGPRLERKHSTITISSQDSASQRTDSKRLFDTGEIRNVDRVVRPRVKGRKPKSASDSNSHVDRTDVVTIDDSQLSFLSPTRPLSATPHSPSARTPIRIADDMAEIDNLQQHTGKGDLSNCRSSARSAHSGQIQISSCEELLGQINMAGSHTQSGPEQRTPSKRQSKRLSDGHASSPRRSETLIRDPPIPASATKTINVRKSMLSSSDDSEKRRIAEGSEDELASGDDQDGLRTSKRRHARSGSPNNLKPTSHKHAGPSNTIRGTQAIANIKGRVQSSESKRDQTFRLASIETLSVDYGGDDLTLTFLDSQKGFVVERGGVSLLASQQSGDYLLSLKHARLVMCNPKLSHHLGLSGAIDDVTGGEVWLEFTNTEDTERCLALVRSMNSKAVFKSATAT